MKKKRIVVLAVLLCAFMPFALFAGGAKETGEKPEPAAKSEYENKILHPYTTLENEYFKMWAQGQTEAAEALGYEGLPVINEGDTDKQVSQIETMISAGVKIVQNVSPDSSNIATIAKLCQQNKVWLVNSHETPEWLTPPDIGDYYVVANFADNYGYGYQMAKLLFDKIGGKGKLLHISGWPGNLPNKFRTMGLEKALKEYPGIELLASQPGKWNRVDSRKVMEDFIIAYPDFDAVFGQNDDVGIGAMIACEEAGISVPIIGIDGNKETMEYIKQGRYYAVMSQHPGWHSGWSTVIAYDAAHGWKPSIAERMVQFDGTVITKENVDWYHDLMWGKEHLPFDWKKMSKVLHPNDWDLQNGVRPLDPRDLWAGMDKPAGYSLPKEYDYEKGYREDFERVKKLYEDHYKSKTLHPHLKK
jgi:ribose transport system substrate-binding protein